MSELEQLKEKTVRFGHTQFAARLAAMSQAARQAISPAATELIDPISIVADPDTVSSEHRLENGPSTQVRPKENEADLRQRKPGNSVKEKIKTPKNSPDSGTLHLCAAMNYRQSIPIQFKKINSFLEI